MDARKKKLERSRYNSEEVAVVQLEDYICKRKKEDGINEYDSERRVENLRVCVNYVFEYFNHYLDTRQGEEKTVLHEKRLDKYRKMLQDYDTEVQEWLLELYASHGKYMHRQLKDYLYKENYFLLFDSEAEFRALSYDVYPKATRKFKFLEGQSEMLYLFIKDTHRVMNLISPYHKAFHISNSIDEWIDATYRKHGVNIYAFCSEWVNYFYSYPDLWPQGHKRKSKLYESRNENHFKTPESLCWEYDYKQKSNLFGLDALYRSMPKKSFTREKNRSLKRCCCIAGYMRLPLTMRTGTFMRNRCTATAFKNHLKQWPKVVHDSWYPSRPTCGGY